MALLIFVLIVIIAEVSLGVLVSARAWSHRPARWLLFYIIGVGVYGLGAVLSPRATDIEATWATTILSFSGLVVLEIAILVLLSALFVPQWWEGRMAIRWILLPYVLIGSLVLIDVVARLGIFVQSVPVQGGGAKLITTEPNSTIVSLVFYVSWLVHQAVLWYNFVRQRNQRALIGAFGVSIFLAVLGGWICGVLQLPELSALVPLPVLLVLAYAVSNTQLFTPTDAAIGLALGSISDAVAIYDAKGQRIYTNILADRLGFADGDTLSLALAAGGIDAATTALLAKPNLEREASATLFLRGRQLAFSHTMVRDQRGRLRGTVLLGRDITDLANRTSELERERSRLAETVKALAAEQRQRESLVATVRDLSLPVIPVLEGVIVLPLIGDFDQARANDFIGTLLQAIERERANLALIDITGVPLLDTAGAAALVQATEAARLLGTRCILVGIRPEIAQTLVSLGVSLGNLTTAATLQQGLRSVLK
jgi:anti-anti-sigma factor